MDLFCGLGGWAEGFLAEGFDVIGFDIERHDYGTGGYPAQLVLQDVLTLDGAQFKDAAVIVASPPCQEYSYMAMPFSRAKAKAAWYREDVTRQLELNCLFNACFRIAHQAGVPLVVENVRGAQPWVGRAAWNYGSFYLWGDVPALMPFTKRGPMKLGVSHRSNGETNFHGSAGRKVAMNFHEHEKTGKPGRSFQTAAVEGMKVPSAVHYAGLRHGRHEERQRLVRLGRELLASAASRLQILGPQSRLRADRENTICTLILDSTGL